MTKIYYNTRSNQEDEKTFIKELAKKFARPLLINDKYILEKEFINQELNVRKIEELINNSNLSINKKNKLLVTYFYKLPDYIKVSRSISEVSVDVVIITESGARLIEFHEKQHRSLSVGRMTPIFSNITEPIMIPRYAQRFLKDLWRLKYLNDFQIVWWDWFYLNIDNAIELILNNPKKKEFHISGKFNFNDFFLKYNYY